jgi:hypothetical protein
VIYLDKSIQPRPDGHPAREPGQAVLMGGGFVLVVPSQADALLRARNALRDAPTAQRQAMTKLIDALNVTMAGERSRRLGSNRQMSRWITSR